MPRRKSTTRRRKTVSKRRKSCDKARSRTGKCRKVKRRSTQKNSYKQMGGKNDIDVEKRLDRLYAMVGKINQDHDDKIELLERKVSRIIEESRVILNKDDFADPEGLINIDNADYFMIHQKYNKHKVPRNKYKPWKNFDLFKAIQERSKKIKPSSSL